MTHQNYRHSSGFKWARLQENHFKFVSIIILFDTHTDSIFASEKIVSKLLALFEKNSFYHFHSLFHTFKVALYNMKIMACSLTLHFVTIKHAVL